MVIFKWFKFDLQGIKAMIIFLYIFVCFFSSIFVLFAFVALIVQLICWSDAAVIYSIPCFCSFLDKNLFRFTSLCRFRHFAWNRFDFSMLVSLIFHSAQSAFKQQLLDKAIQNEQIKYKKQNQK